MRIFLCLFCCLCSLPTVVARDIYRWVDEQGNIHFSDHAPAGPPFTAFVPPEPNLIDAAKPVVRAGKNRPAKPPRGRTDAVQTTRDRRVRAEKCHKAEQGLKQIRAKKRVGYTAKQGRDLKRRADRYTADRRFYCG